MKTILIAVWLMTYNGRLSLTSISVEYDDEIACETAVAKIRSQGSLTNQVLTCTPKKSTQQLDPARAWLSKQPNK